MKTIGIDIGSTSISLSCFDIESGTEITSKSVSNDSLLKSPCTWEYILDPKSVFSTAADALNLMLDEYPDVRAIGLTGQMHGILYTDADGQAVSPLYSWQDQRGAVSLDGELPMAIRSGIVQDYLCLLGMEFLHI